MSDIGYCTTKYMSGLTCKMMIAHACAWENKLISNKMVKSYNIISDIGYCITMYMSKPTCIIMSPHACAWEYKIPF